MVCDLVFKISVSLAGKNTFLLIEKILEFFLISEIIPEDLANMPRDHLG